ncbi:COG4315 family predicted lipoprotein [Vulcaniibacterium tengchongense]|uniref:Putative lipoprotein with Yx(FWY)xxD motif n=1 Tax=Vulcaniibacterium tengchongense TaxID=1273429 RepID=A0A3N4V1T1_9GAMM|nr:hypothetical protein [Vulcaniibacterium tengchongense]RPE76932.1 putative lipoprotein with Yx(FWY)xxD motif [Vulcaniibacterium tengchongense]
MITQLPLRAVALASAVLLLVACQERRAVDDTRAQREAGPSTRPAPSGDPVEGTSMEAASGEAPLQLAMSRTAPGHVVDNSGAAVYALEGNRDGNKCDPRCEEVWPPVIARTQRPQAGVGIDGGRLGVVPRADGTLQATYGGQPLYRYSGDGGTGRTSGHGVRDQWGRWSLLGLDGQPLPDASPQPGREAGRAERPARQAR